MISLKNLLFILQSSNPSDSIFRPQKDENFGKIFDKRWKVNRLESF